ncbi:hypothetical protein DPMN_152364 [Dreissena polymorpha]|uniref:Uncharacterized protein n=1 Tax=Dreissena polymorpha TaxID=45954 RepID=A0A9D4FL51_DREPO|nr:hypothetical protein DPMN_152364 [Dreissena polymorpha]
MRKQTKKISGWNRRINTQAGPAELGFYMLIPFLQGKAVTVDLRIQLVYEHALARGHIRKSTENYSTPETNMRTMKSSPHNY